MIQKDSDLTLDKSLKALYSALRYAGATLMAIRFMYEGKQWEVDKPEEAIRLREALRIASIRHTTEAGELLTLSEESVWTPDVFTEFVESTGTLGQAFIKYLLKHPNVMAPSSQITKALGLKKEIELAGVLSGLSKQLKKVGLRPHQLYFVDVRWDSKEKERFIGIDKGFELAASEMGWPEK